MSTSDAYSASSGCTPEQVADVLAALGTLMRELHQQDLALQNAVSQLAANPTLQGAHVYHMQHIDLVTQTHDDLARFLPELASCLSSTNFDQSKLAEILRLQSLRDQLLNTQDDPNSEDDLPSGELSLL